MEKLRFIGVGPPRTGTTWLFENLVSHPELGIPDKKSLNFFNEDYERGIEYYNRNFSGFENSSVIGEISPLYFGKPDVLNRIITEIPDVKIVAVARDPVSRLESHCRLINSLRGTAKPLRQIWKEKIDLLEYGFYHKHLSAWEQHLDTTQIKVFSYLELKTQPDHFLKAILEFLNVATDYSPPKLGSVVGQSIIPKYQFVEKARQAIHRYLTKIGFARAILVSKQLGLSDRLRKINKGHDDPRFNADDKAEIRNIYDADFAQFQERYQLEIAEKGYMKEG